jgi:hypothetical protein
VGGRFVKKISKDRKLTSGVSYNSEEGCAGIGDGQAMLFDPLSYNGALAIVYVETNAEALAHGTAHNSGNIDCSAVGQGKRDVNRLSNRQRHCRFDLHAADGEIAAFRGHAIGTIVASDGDSSFERNAGRATDLAAELKLSFRRYPPLGSRIAPENCQKQGASHDSGRY